MAGNDKVVDRTTPTPDPERAAFVKNWAEAISDAKEIYKDTFEQMREDATFARGRQWPGQTKDDERYVANITLRHINQRVAALYAKNPRVSATRRRRMVFKVWDGRPESLAQAQQAVEMFQQSAQMAAQAAAGGQMVMDGGQMQPPAEAMALLQDVQQGRALNAMMDRVAKTAEYVAQYSLNEPIPKFKKQAKQLVRRALTCKVGYVRLGYQRIMGLTPDLDARIKDATDKIAHLQALASDAADGEIHEGDKEMEELKLGLTQLHSQAKQIVREGITFDFPRSWNIIIDPDCHQLSGFVGARWIAQEFLFSPRKVQEIYGVDVKGKYTAFDTTGARADKRRKSKEKLCAVYEIYDMENQQVITICDGYPDLLKEPSDPDIKLDQFHPFYTLMFNEVEDDENIYPPSDVELVRSMQVEYNRSREGLRKHRIANRPAYLGTNGVLDTDSLNKLQTHDDSELIMTNLKVGDDVGKAIQKKPTFPIDPAMYDTEGLFADVLRTTGDQEATLGGTSGATATETTVAETTRVTALQSCADDLDEFLTDLMRGVGQVLFTEMSADTVRRIAGPGAAWPELSREDVAEEIYLEIKAGSSGRPNKALKIAAFERLAPFLVQIPGVKSSWLGAQMVQEVDEGIDIEDAIAEGLPSIVAMNGAIQPSTGNPATDPAQQGRRGSDNAPAAGQSQPAARGALGMARDLQTQRVGTA